MPTIINLVAQVKAVSVVVGRSIFVTAIRIRSDLGVCSTQLALRIFLVRAALLAVSCPCDQYLEHFLAVTAARQDDSKFPVAEDRKHLARRIGIGCRRRRLWNSLQQLS